MADTKAPGEPSVPTLADLDSILGQLDTGMRVVVVHSEEEADRVFAAQEADGYHCGCMSNTGLPAGSFRLTFLPKSAFTPEPDGGYERTGPEFLDGPPVSKKPTRNIQDWLDDEGAVAQVPYVSDTAPVLPPMVSVELEQLTTLVREGIEVVYYDIGVAEHWATGNKEQGRVRRRIQTRQRVRDGDILAARDEAIRRSVDFALGGLVGYRDWDSGNGD